MSGTEEDNSAESNNYCKNNKNNLICSSPAGTIAATE
jgi:hypothetical protein